MSVMTVLIAAPSKVVAPENLPKPTAPALHQAAITLPLQPASDQQLTQPSPALVAATAPVTTPASTMPTATAAVAAQPAEQRTEASFDAAYLNNPAPAYPLISRRQGESGKVLLLVQVTPHGTAAQVEIKQSCGFPRLDEAALEAVRKWHFVPARQGDVAVAASVLVPLSFKLNS
jgi:protein TonB